MKIQNFKLKTKNRPLTASAVLVLIIVLGSVLSPAVFAKGGNMIGGGSRGKASTKSRIESLKSLINTYQNQDRSISGSMTVQDHVNLKQYIAQLQKELEQLEAEEKKRIDDEKRREEERKKSSASDEFYDLDKYLIHYDPAPEILATLNPPSGLVPAGETIASSVPPVEAVVTAPCCQIKPELIMGTPSPELEAGGVTLAGPTPAKLVFGSAQQSGTLFNFSSKSRRIKK